MSTDGSKLIDGEKTHAILGAAMEVHNALGHGLSEKPYENALVLELGLRSIPCSQQKSFDVVYKGVKVGHFIPDLIAFDSVVVDTKAIAQITDIERGQMLTYLRVTKLRVGLIINFAKPKLEWERIVL